MANEPSRNPQVLESAPTSMPDEQPPGLSLNYFTFGQVAALWRRARCQTQYPFDVWIYAIIFFLVEFSHLILMQIMESYLTLGICKKLWPGGHHTRTKCEGDGWGGSWEAMFYEFYLYGSCLLAAMIVNIPLGRMLDKRGSHRPLLLNITSVILFWALVIFIWWIPKIPADCFLLAPIALLIGGGPEVTQSLVFAAISNRITPYQRTTAFSILEGTSLIALLLGRFLGTLSEAAHYSVSLTLAIIAFTILIVALGLADNTKRSGTKVFTPGGSVASEHDPLLGDQPDFNNSVLGDVNSETLPRYSKAIIFTTAVASFFLVSIARSPLNLYLFFDAGMVAWMADRFHQTYEHAYLISTLHQLATCFLLVAIVPFVNFWLKRSRNIEVSSRSLQLSTFIALVFAMGFLLTTFAPNLALLSVGLGAIVLGSGLTVMLRSFFASHLSTEFSGRLFAGISVAETIGRVIGIGITYQVETFMYQHQIHTVGLQFLVSAMSIFALFGGLVYIYIKH